MLTDERVDALLRRLDVDAVPDREFAAASASLLLSIVHQTRREDASRFGRARRDLVEGFSLIAPGTATRRLAPITLAAVLLLGALVVLILIAGGAVRKPVLGNGPLIVAVQDRLLAIDMADGSVRTLGLPAAHPVHVTRSPDGARVAYWETGSSADQLFVADIDGATSRRLASDQVVTWNGCLDAWSPDSRRLATSVLASGVASILVVDTRTGDARFVTPSDEAAECQLWSPDGRWIGFDRTPAGGPTTIAVVRPDGGDLHTVSSVRYGSDAEGVNSWSPDGIWIYFNAMQEIWRTNVQTGASESLTRPSDFSVAPALSPDGTRMSYIVSTPTNWDLYVANADGSDPHLVMKDARNNGWSPDGRWVLSRWMPSDRAGGLLLVAPDGSGHRLVVPEDVVCPNRDEGCDMHWGQQKP
jgi:sugar lactone lactonase YvrE